MVIENNLEGIEIKKSQQIQYYYVYVLHTQMHTHTYIIHTQPTLYIQHIIQYIPTHTMHMNTQYIHTLHTTNIINMHTLYCTHNTLYTQQTLHTANTIHMHIHTIYMLLNVLTTYTISHNTDPWWGSEFFLYVFILKSLLLIQLIYTYCQEKEAENTNV